MEMEKQTIPAEKPIDLNEILENEMDQDTLETQNECEKCYSSMSKKGRQKLIALTTVIFVTLVISIVVAAIHLYSRSNGKYML